MEGSILVLATTSKLEATAGGLNSIALFLLVVLEIAMVLTGLTLPILDAAVGNSATWF